MATYGDISAEQRRLKRLALEEQLRLLDEEEFRYQRVSQPPSSANFPTLTAPAASSSRSSWSQPRPDSGSAHISPQSNTRPQHTTGWGASSSQANHLSTSFLDSGLAAYGSGPTQSSGPSNHDRSFSSASPANSGTPNMFAAQQSRYFTSDGQPLIPYTNLPVPSKAQIHSYLVKYMNLPEEHQSSWSIEGHSLDSHTLFNLVVQMGGSHRITSYDAWPHVAAMFGFPIFRDTPQGPRSTPDTGSQLRKMFMTYLGGLEALWDKTKAADSLMSMDQAVSQDASRLTQTNHHRQTQATSSSSGSQYGTQNRPSYAHSQSNTTSRTASSSAHRQHGTPSPTSHVQQTVPSQPSVKSIAGLLSGPPRPPASASKATHPAPPQATSSARIQSPQQLPAVPAYIPPFIDTFEHMVQRNILPLPDLGAPIHIPAISNAVSYYAWRAHELRIEIRKMTINAPRRNLSMDELMFWSKLLLILKKNPEMTIPKPSNLPGQTPIGQSSSPAMPATAVHRESEAIMESIRTDPNLQLTLPTSAVPDLNLNGEQNGESSQPPKKKRGRKPKGQDDATDSQGDAAPKKRHRRKDGEPPRPQGRQPKLDENGNRINPPKKRSSLPAVPPAATEGITATPPTTTNGTDRPAASSTPVPTTTPSAMTQPGDFLRQLQSQSRNANASSSPTSLPTAINPALLRRVLPPAVPATPVTPATAAAPASSSTTPASANPITPSLPASQPTAPASQAEPSSSEPKSKNPKHVEAAKRRWEQRKEKLAAMTEEERKAYIAAVAQARLEKGKAKASGTPNSKANSSLASITLSASPRKTINLSGSRVSVAQMRQTDAATPTKIVGIKQVLKRGPKPKPKIQPVAPETLAAALAHVNSLPPTTLNSAMEASGLVSEVSASQPLTMSRKGKGPIRSSSQPRASTPVAGAHDGPVPSSSRKRTELFVEMISRRKPEASETPSRLSKVERATPRKRQMATRSAGPIRETRSSGPVKQLATRSGVLKKQSTVQFKSPRSAGPGSQTRARSPPSTKRPRLSSPLPTRAQSRPVSSSLRPRQPSSPLTPSTRANRLATVHRPSPLSRSIIFPKHVKLTKVDREVRQDSIEFIGTATKGKQPVIELVSSQKSKEKRIRRGPIDRAKVVIKISRKRRDKLIQRGHYDAFRDDDSDEDDEPIRRYSYLPLRPMKPLPRNSIARSARPKDPEPIPVRFFIRPGPALLEPFRSILSEDTLLKRTHETPCGWKGCDSVLASEVLLEKHVLSRDHLRQGYFLGGTYGRDSLWRCHWKGCEEPCFMSKEKLWQHMKARHISRNLKCPWLDCDSSSPGLSHLSRHVMRHHDDDPEGVAPIADLSERLAPPHPPADHPLPEIATTDQLITQPISGAVYATIHRREWARLKVANNCIAGENPVMHVEHPPHMLDKIEDTDTEWDSDESDDLLDAAGVRVERLADRGWNRPPRRFTCVVEIPTKKSWLAYPEELEDEVGDNAEADDEQAGDEMDDEAIDLTAEEAAWILADNDDEGEVDFTMDAEELSINELGEGSGTAYERLGDTEEEEQRLFEQMRVAQDELRHWDEMNAQEDEADEQELLDALDAAEAAEAAQSVDNGSGELLVPEDSQGMAVEVAEDFVPDDSTQEVVVVDESPVVDPIGSDPLVAVSGTVMDEPAGDPLLTSEVEVTDGDFDDIPSKSPVNNDTPAISDAPLRSSNDLLTGDDNIEPETGLNDTESPPVAPVDLDSTTIAEGPRSAPGEASHSAPAESPGVEFGTVAEIDTAPAERMSIDSPTKMIHA